MNIDLLQKCYKDYDSKKSTYEKMYQYYVNNSDKINNYSAQEYQESHTMNLNYIKKFVKEEVSYSVGSPISFASKIDDDNIIADINYYTYHWNKKHDEELLKNILIYGTTYELYYIDRDGQFSAKIISPKSGYAYVDDFGNAIYFLHIYNLKFDDTTYIDVYTDDAIYHFDSDFNEIKPPNTHIFGVVPVAIGEISEEKDLDTLYNDLKDVQDGLSIIASDGVNEITNTRDAILKSKGFEMTDEQAQNLKKYRLANLPDTAESDLQWLIKNLNPAYQELMLNYLEESLYKISFHINNQEKMQSNTSSLALRTRLINLEQKTKLNNKSVENVIMKRLYFLFYYLKIVKSKDYDYRNISVKFNSVIPSDDLMIAQIISQMGDKISLKTALKNFSWVENVDSEIKEIKKEQSELLQGQSLLDNANTGVDSNGQV